MGRDVGLRPTLGEGDHVTACHPGHPSTVAHRDEAARQGPILHSQRPGPVGRPENKGAQPAHDRGTNECGTSLPTGRGDGLVPGKGDRGEASAGYHPPGAWPGWFGKAFGLGPRPHPFHVEQHLPAVERSGPEPETEVTGSGLAELGDGSADLLVIGPDGARRLTWRPRPPAPLLPRADRASGRRPAPRS